MIFLMFKRVLGHGFKNFQRQGTMTLASIFMLTAALSLLTSLFMINGIAAYTINSLREKIDVSVYFKEDAREDAVLAAREELKNLPEIRAIEYVSPDTALERFRVQYENDPVIMASLLEIGRNPLLAALNIKVWEPNQYEAVVNFLEASAFEKLIDSVDYYQNKAVIERLFSITSGAAKVLLIGAILLALMAALITFNTIKISIDSMNKELEIMHLVGANKLFAAGPLIVQGALVGVISAAITLILFALLTVFLNGQIQSLTSGFSLINYFWNRLWMLLPLELLIGAGLGTCSAWLAVRKYLK